MVDYGITRGGSITGPVTITASAPAGGLLHLVNTASAPSDHTLIVEGVNATDRAVGLLATGDTQDRWNTTIAGLQQWGTGAAGLDTNLYRPSANALESDDIIVQPAGFLKLTGDTTFTLAAQTATTLLVAVQASATYLMDAVVIFDNATGITTPSWTGPAGAAMQWCDSSASLDYSSTIGATNNTYAANAGTRMAFLKGVLSTAATAGNLTLTLGVSAGTTTLRTGSTLCLSRKA